MGESVSRSSWTRDILHGVLAARTVLERPLIRSSRARDGMRATENAGAQSNTVLRRAALSPAAKHPQRCLETSTIRTRRERDEDRSGDGTNPGGTGFCGFWVEYVSAFSERAAAGRSGGTVHRRDDCIALRCRSGSLPGDWGSASASGAIHSAGADDSGAGDREYPALSPANEHGRIPSGAGGGATLGVSGMETSGEFLGIVCGEDGIGNEEARKQGKHGVGICLRRQASPAPRKACKESLTQDAR